MEIVENIKVWASERGLYEKGDAMTQFCKLSEEFGELGKAIMNKDEEEFSDAIGDMFVVMTNLVELSNKYFDENRVETYLEDVVGDGGSKMTMHNEDWNSIELCIESAYSVIKNRTGSMKNGTFVKDER